MSRYGQRTRVGQAVSTFGQPTAVTPLVVEYLVIAGGGGGGSKTAGGGGAGGYRSSVTGESSGGGALAETALTLSKGTNYAVAVGAGGLGAGARHRVVGRLPAAAAERADRAWRHRVEPAPHRPL